MAVKLLFFGILISASYFHILTVCGDHTINDQKEVLSCVTAGANIKPVDYARVFVDEMELTFIIPDMPKLPTLINRVADCSKYFCKKYSRKCMTELELCKLAQSSDEITQESLHLLRVIDKMFTFNNINLTKIKFDGSQPSEADFTDKEAFKNAQLAGLPWYGKTKMLMEGRYMASNYSNTRNKRGIPVLPFVKAAGPLLLHFGKKALFFAKDALLDVLTERRARVPASLKLFTDMADVNSEYSSQQQQVQNVIDIVSKHYGRAENNLNDEPLQIDLVTRFSDVQMNSNNVVNFAIMMMGHMNSLADCRAGNLPILFVPPLVLESTLYGVEEKLDENLEMVIKSTEARIYYTMKAATCSFDDEGGIVRVKTFIKPKAATYRLFEFQSLGFAWYNKTCELSVPSGYVVRDEVSGTVFPISELDEEMCSPKTSNGLCKLPQAANADVPHHYCLMTLMQGGSTGEVKSSCPLTCRDGVRITSSQLDDFTFVVAHLPSTGAKVTCDNGIVEAVEHNVDIGAIRITLGCGCTLQYRSKIIARSSSKICALKFQSFKLEHLIPLQLSTLDDMVQQMGDSFQEVTFKNGENIIDYTWSPETDSTDDDIISSKINIWSTLIQLFQFFCMVCVFYKYRLGPFAFMAVALDGANAQSNKQGCVVSNDLSIMMYIVIGLLILLVVPSWLYCFFSKCKKMFDRAVDNAAVSRRENPV